MTKPLFDLSATNFASIDTICPVVSGAIVSKPLLNEECLRQIIFAVDEGQGLSEHRAPFAATVHVLRGRMTFTVSGSTREMATGAWVAMPPDELHALQALEPTVFLLTLVPTPD